jgi:hypothetical protein
MEQIMQKFLARLVCIFLGAALAEAQSPSPRSRAVVAPEPTVSTDATEPVGRPAGTVDLAAIVDLLGKRIDERATRDSFVLLNQGMEPAAHVDGNAFVGESRAYFFPANGMIVHSVDYSGAGQRIGLVTLIGSAREVYLGGREYALEVFRGRLPLRLKWGQSRADVLRRLGCPAASNEGISLSDRPKSAIHETRDADEFQQGSVIVRLIYTESGCLEEIDLQQTISPARQ